MARFAKILILCLLTISGIQFSGERVHAQDGVTAIPVPGSQFTYELSPDGKTIAVAQLGVIYQDEVFEEYLPIYLIDVAGGTIRAALTGHTDYATDIAFSPDSSMLATYHGGGYLYLWDVKTASLIKVIPVVPGSARLEFLPDGKTLAAAQQNGIQLWDIKTGFMTAYITPRYDTFDELRTTLSDGRGSTFFVDAAVLGKNGAVATLTTGGSIQVWEAPYTQSIIVRTAPENIPTLYITRLAAAGDRLVYLHSADAEIHVWDLAQSQEIAVFPEITTRVNPALSPDGTQLAIAEEGMISLVNVATGEKTPVAELQLPAGVRVVGLTVKLTFTPDGQRLVYGGFASLDNPENVIYVIDLP